VPKQYTHIPELLLKIFEKRISSGGTVNRRIGLLGEDPRKITLLRHINQDFRD
jgi:hypothetical protein